MKIYEIRIMAGRQSGPDIYSGSHLNDHAAVRRAMMLVKPRQWVEVWCGARCIYAGSPACTPHPMIAPQISGASPRPMH
ncbi:MAG TPA: hypothetical protein VJQ06_04280 [Rhizomicrobium sp.]|nr:hypothetical protein [Rhizomicrobium sp.]